MNPGTSLPARRAAAPLPSALDTLLARVPDEGRPAAALMHQLGMVQALTFARAFADVSLLMKLQEIKESEAYTALGLTWEQFCAGLPGSPSRRTVDERLLELAELGEEFMEVANQVGLGRGTLRVLRAVDADARPKLLETGELEFPGGRRVPMDAEHRDELREAMQDFAAEMERMKQDLDIGRQQYREHEKELGRLTIRLKELEKRDEVTELDAVERQFQAAFREVLALADMVIREKPDAGRAEAWARMLNQQMQPLLDYSLSAGRTFDPDDLDERLAELDGDTFDEDMDQ